MTDVKPWYDNERFWEATQQFMFPPERWDSAAASVDDLVALLNISPPAAVLDLCSGPGRYSIPLAQHGFRVTSVDRTELYLNQLRSRRQELSLMIDIVTSDMRDFVREDSFDAVLNIFTSFGYFEDPADDRRVLENIYASLKPGGKLFLETASRDWIVANFQARDWQERAGAFLLDERELIDDCTRIRSRWIIPAGDQTERWEFTLRLYSVLDFKDVLHGIGFSGVQAFANSKGEPYTHKLSRLVIVAEK